MAETRSGKALACLRTWLSHPGSPARRRLVIATDDLPARDRFEWWRSQFAPLHSTEVTANQRPGFAARGEDYPLGSMVIARYTTPARRVVRTPSDVRRAEVDLFSLRVMLRGCVASHRDRRGVRAGPGQLLLSTSTEAYCDEYSGGEWVTLLAPRRDFPALAGVPTGLVTGVRGSLLADYLVSLDRRLDAARAVELPALVETTRAMIHGCLVGDKAPVLLEPAERRVVLRLAVERAIGANLGSARLDAERICALAGVSRSTLFRLFEPDGGVSAYVRALRLRSIDADLRDPRFGETTVAALAARWGMHNPAAFSRAYRRAFGRTPGDTRRAVVESGAMDGPGSGATFIKWLR